ncbi:MAG: pseudouridine synthase [Nannocystaceae bacterium]
MTSRTIEHSVVDPEDVGARADVVLGRRLPGLSRRVARQMALAGKLEIDGERAPPSARVALGQRLALRVEPTPSPSPGAPELRVLASTPAIVYVDKPVGVAVHRLRPDEPPALADLVAARFPELRDVGDDPRELGALHRLDRPTSGVVAFARTAEAWAAGREGFARGEVRKHYAAVGREARGDLAGAEAWLAAPKPIGDAPLPSALADELRRLHVAAQELPMAIVRAPLGRGDQRDKVVVRGDGLAATTDLQVLLDAGARRLLLLRLRSGRRHQARVHLAAAGWPIVGDRRYGGEPGPRLLLHAWSLDLSPAIAGERPIVAPLPPEFAASLAAAPR